MIRLELKTSELARLLRRATDTTQGGGWLKNAKTDYLNTSPEARIAILTSDMYNLRRKHE